MKVNGRWVSTGKAERLEYYDGLSWNEVLAFVQDKDDPEIFWYVSDLMNVEHDCIESSSIELAKEEFEDMYEDYLRDMISEYESLLELWNEDV